MTRPVVSVILPAHNGQCWLRESLDSVLGQSRPPDEVIVVDDGSSDGTADVLRSYAPRLTIRRQEQQGIGVARNVGISMARGDLLAFIDQDDIWLPDKLQRQLHHVGEEPAAAVLYADAEEFGDRVFHPSYHALFPRLREPVLQFADVVRFNVPLVSSMLVRADFLRRHAIGFHPHASGVDDVGLFLEVLARGGRFACLDEVLVRRRLHAHNLSKDHRRRFAQRIALYTDLLYRRIASSREQRRSLRWGLRDAWLRVGECDRAGGNARAAGAAFRRGLGWDRTGLAALRGLVLTCLPNGLVHRLRGFRARIRRPDSDWASSPILLSGPCRPSEVCR